jgi:DNA ligase-1
MKFARLSDYLIDLEKTSSRIQITEILSRLIKDSDNSEIEPTINLIMGQLAPSFKSIVFNIADNMMLQSLSKAYDIDLIEVKKLYKQSGDLGLTAEKLASSKKLQATSHELSISNVYQKLLKIALLEGEGSVDQKINAMADLLKQIDKKSSRFLARIPVGRLRLGFSDKTIIDAVSWSLKGDKSLNKSITNAYEVYPDIAYLTCQIKKSGISAISKITPKIGVPVKPMLAARLKSPEDMIKKMDKVAIEPKFDGLRVQIHYQKDKNIKAFTRNLNEISEMFPELNNLSKYIKASSAILDSEAVGLDPATMKMVDFQHTMQRRRKHEIRGSADKTPIRFQLFDLLLVDNKSLMQKAYIDRRKNLEKIIKTNKTFVVDKKIITDDPEVITDKHSEYLKSGLEGAMIKKIDSNYVSGRTGWRWVKMKEVESSHAKLSDTIDAVIMGYTQGRGKRAQFGLGQFLAGVRQNDNFVTITKVGTGLSEDQLQNLANKLNKITVSQKPKNYEVHKDLEPDYWVEPQVVVELAADEITNSPKHTARLALRFPRLIRLREDKSAFDATTLKELKALSNLQ